MNANRKRNINQIESNHDDSMDTDEKRRNGPEIYDAPKIVRLLVLLGNSTNAALEQNIEKLASICVTNIEDYRFQILDTLAECATYTPYKHTIYSPIIGLLNAKVPEVTKELLDDYVLRINNYLNEGEFQYALNVLTMVAELINVHVVDPAALMATLEALVEAGSASDDKRQADFCIFAVMNCLPVAGLELSDSLPTQFHGLMSKIDQFMASRDNKFTDCLKIWKSNAKAIQKEKLESLWDQVKNLEKREWIDEGFTKQYFATFKTVLDEGQMHSLNPLSLPESTTDRVYPPPQIVFRIFEAAHIVEEAQTLPPSESIDRYLLEQALTGILHQHQYDRKACADAMLNYVKKDTHSINHIIVEVIFGLLLTLPDAPHIHILYGSLFIECCKLQPSKVPQVLALAAELIFRGMDSMQMICVDRLIEWFSYHLSNFQYRWTWSDWIDQIDPETHSIKKYFLEEVIRKCVTYAYHEKISQMLPDKCSLMPAEATFSSTFDSETDGELMELVNNFDNLIIRKTDADAMLKNLYVATPEVDADSDQPMEEIEEVKRAYDRHKFEVFFCVLLDKAKSSFTHNFAAFNRYLPTFLNVIEELPICRMDIIKAIFIGWKNAPQYIILLIDKLFKMKVLDTTTIIEFIFENDLEYIGDKKHFHDILFKAIQRHVTFIKGLTGEYERLKSKIEKVQAKLENNEGGDIDFRNASIEMIESDIDVNSLENPEMWLSESNAISIEQKTSLEAHTLVLEKAINHAIEKNFVKLITLHESQDSSNEFATQNVSYDFVFGRFKQFVILNLDSVKVLSPNIIEKYLKSDSVYDDLRTTFLNLIAVN
uniref:Nuclear cap-binding protein subunit 1 n=1 Tax=Rhabditophanes sp. KR3021 TaxID=114890 RepID=A0AC35TPX5_9BILA